MDYDAAEQDSVGCKRSPTHSPYHRHYVAFNYFSSDATYKQPVVSAFGEAELFEVIDRAHRENMRIAIFRLGDCVIDWS